MQNTDTLERLERLVKTLTARIARLELSRKVVAPFSVVDRNGHTLMLVDSRGGEAYLMLTAPGAMAPSVVLSADEHGAEATTFDKDGAPVAILNAPQFAAAPDPDELPPYDDPFQDPPEGEEALNRDDRAEGALHVAGELPVCWPVNWGENDAESER